MAMSVDIGNILSVPRKRWLRCFILHILICAILWLVLGFNISSFCFWSRHGSVQLPFSQRFMRFLGFLASQVVFLLGEAVVTHPEDKDAASAADIFIGVLKLAWRAIVGASLDRDIAQSAAVLARKLQTSRDRALFVFFCAISGSLSIVSLTWSSQSRLSAMEEACRGTALGLSYAFLHLYSRRMILTFPVIQRPTFFCFKLGLAKMIKTAFKLAVASIPFAEVAILILNSSTLAAVGMKSSERSLFTRELDFVFSALFTAICWEMCHHLIHILHTKRHKFAPPFGSSAAEASPSELLLIALEETEKSSLTHYLAVLDLFMLSENNADSWRLCALFEETGETYQRVVLECLKPLDILTMKLAKGLDGSSEAYKKDFLKQQMQSPGQQLVLSTYQIFDDYQLCSWCARIVAAVTAFSKNNDRYGVAQLRGCNGAVVSSLLSCFLVIEVYLGRRSSIQPGQVVGIHSIKWTVPSRGLVADTGRKQGFPFRKKSELHKKAYAMADVLRTSLYQIVATFRKEMVLSGSAAGGVVIAERDWLGKGQPLYGTHELHLQNLRLFLDFRL